MNQTLPLVVEPADPVRPLPVFRHAEADAALIALWLGRHASPHTRRNYARRASAFLRHVGRPLGAVRLSDLQLYLAALDNKASATRANAAAALKSLFRFAHEIGYLAVNVGTIVKASPVKNTLAERILDEAAVHRMFALETSPRNRALLTLLYGGGIRISEACTLC